MDWKRVQNATGKLQGISHNDDDNDYEVGTVLGYVVSYYYYRYVPYDY